ncbi:hypothetical protein [Edaphobacter modestus]|nr:hypothetical protein [Edaphobacter modestus]
MPIGNRQAPVLLCSGIEGGLRGQVEVEREPVTVDAALPLSVRVK